MQQGQSAFNIESNVPVPLCSVQIVDLDQGGHSEDDRRSNLAFIWQSKESSVIFYNPF